MDMKIVAWLVDDETPNARVVLGEGWPSGGNYFEALVGMIDVQNAIHAAVAAERERCAKVCESTYPKWNPDDATFQKPCFDTPAECAAAIRGVG